MRGGGGIDYEMIGMRMGMTEALGTLSNATLAWRERAEAAEGRLRLAEADLAATDAGRLAQLHVLRRALEVVAPLDPVLRTTGRHYSGGDPEKVYEASFADAYDDAARGTDLALCVRPMTPQQRADAVEAAVLAEPITVMGWWLWEQIMWRGGQYRTVSGAKRARAEAAGQARQEAMNS